MLSRKTGKIKLYLLKNKKGLLVASTKNFPQQTLNILIGDLKIDWPCWKMSIEPISLVIWYSTTLQQLWTYKTTAFISILSCLNHHINYIAVSLHTLMSYTTEMESMEVVTSLVLNTLLCLIKSRVRLIPLIRLFYASLLSCTSQMYKLSPNKCLTS